VGVPLSVLQARFAAEQPAIQFDDVKQFCADCWWHGAERGANISHLSIKRAAATTGVSSTSASAGSAAAAAASTSAAPAAASSSSRPSSASSRATVTLKPTAAMPAAGLSIVREQSMHIETRTRQLLRYLLQQAVLHARSYVRRQRNNTSAAAAGNTEDPDGRTLPPHRALCMALVGHCGFFARLSGHTMDNCEIVELEWGTILRRAALKGFVTLPPGLTHSDVGDVRKQGRLMRHWMDELGAPMTQQEIEELMDDGESTRQEQEQQEEAQRRHGEDGDGVGVSEATPPAASSSGSSGSSGSRPPSAAFSAQRPPPSANTADLVPRRLAPTREIQ